MKLHHYTWEEVPIHFGGDKDRCQQDLEDWKADKVKDYTMTVEFYPGEVLDDDPERIKVAIDDFNNTFPESKVEWDGEDTNIYIVLDTMEKQLWSFFTPIEDE